MSNFSGPLILKVTVATPWPIDFAKILNLWQKGKNMKSQSLGAIA